MPQPNSDPFSGFGETEAPQGADPFSGFGVTDALPRAIGAVTANPDKAAEAVRLSKTTGVPPLVINGNIDTFKQQKQMTEASHYVQSNPYLADLITGTPLAAEIIGDDYPALDKLSTEGAKLNDHPIIKKIINSLAEGFGKLEPTITEEQKKAYPKISAALDPFEPVFQFPQAAMRTVNAAIYGGAETFSQLLTASGVSENTSDRVKREMINFAGFLMAEGAAKTYNPSALKANIAMKQQLTPVVREPPKLTPAEATHIEAGEVPPPGSGLITDHLHNIQAHVDAAQLDKVVEAVQDSKLKERSPEVLQDYLDQILGDKQASIPVEAVNELYKDKTPGPGDGVLNIEPGQLDLANAAGTDVQIKLSKLLAEIDPPAYEKMRDNLRLRDEGVTLAEAKELDLEPKKVAEGEEPLTARDQIKKSFYFQPLFENAKAVGMDEAQYKKYFDRFTEADNADLQKEIAQKVLLAKRQLSPEWKAAEPAIRDDVTNEFKAYDLLNQGFNNGLPKTDLKARIDAEVQSRMEAKFGGNLSSLALDEASDSALASHYIDLMDDEYKALAKAKGDDSPISLAEMKQWTEAKFNELPKKEAAYETFRRGAERGYKDAAKAVLAGKFDEALKAQQRRLVSSLMAKEAKSFEKEIEKGERVFDRAVKNDAISSIDQEHLDHVHKILRDIGYTDKEFQEPQLSLQDLIAQSDRQLAVAYWLDKAGKNYKTLTVEEQRALTNSITSLMHVGKQAKLVESIHGAAEIENVAFDIAKEGERFDFIKQPLNKSILQRVGSLWRQVQGANLLVERMLDYHDGFNPRGPLTSFMDRPLRASYNKELKLSEQVRDRLRAMEEYVDKSINDPIQNNYIWDPRANDYMNMTRKNLRHFILYMGSDSGIEKTTKGFNIDPISAWNLIKQNATAADIKWANGMWKTFDELWPEASAMERRYTGVEPDKIKARPFEITLKDGTVVKAEGGYTPIVYDKARSTIEADIAKKGDLFDSNYFPAISTPHGYTKSRTDYAGYLDLNGTLMATKLQQMVHDIAFRESVKNANKLINNKVFMDTMIDRWGAERARLLPGWIRDIANVHNVDDSYAMNAAAYMAAARQNVISTLIFLNPGTFLKHSLTAMGMSASQVGLKEYAGASTKFGLRDILQSSRELIMGRKTELTPDPEFAQAAKEVTDSGDRGKSVREFIWNSSALMRNRQGPYMDTIRGAYERVNNAGLMQDLAGLRQTSINVGRAPVALGDSLSAMPTWYAAYKKSFAETGDHAQSVFQADRAMTRAHGSKFIGDRPAVMRTSNTFSGEIARWFTPLMSFWNHNFNNLLQWGWDASATASRGIGSEPGAQIGSLTQRVIALAVVPILVEEFAAPPLSGHGGYGRQMLSATIRYFGSFFPGLRDITNAVAGGYEPSVGLLGTVYKSMESFAKDVARKGTGKTVSANWLTHFMTAFGMVTGIGGTQVGKTVTGITGDISGRERPRNLTEFRQLLRTGHAQPPRGQ